MTIKTERCLLLAGIAVPILYFGTVFGSALLYPGYNHVTQYASELGSASARYPAVFNTGIVLTGLAFGVAGFGFFFAVRRLTGKSLLAALIGLTLLAMSFSTLMGGLFPIPDDRHGGYGVGMAFHLMPLLLPIALWKRRSLRGLNIFLLVMFVVMVGFFAIMMGAGSLMTRANVGVFQRIYALTSFPWLAVAAYRLRKELLTLPA